MAQDLPGGAEAYRYSEQIADETKRRLVQEALDFAMAPLARLSPEEASRIRLDMPALARMLEAMMDDLDLLIALAEGAPLREEPLEDLVGRAGERGLVVHGAEALAAAAQIDEPRTRNLLAHGLAVSLRWLLAASESQPAVAEPVDLLLHARMLEEVFRAPHSIAYRAAGKPDLPWLVE